MVYVIQVCNIMSNVKVSNSNAASVQDQVSLINELLNSFAAHI